jgi:hypothetical protein
VHEFVPAGQWLAEGHFNNVCYRAKPGDPPVPLETDDFWRGRINTCIVELQRQDIDFVSPSGDERPKQAARRLEAKLRMESRALREAI